MSKQTFTQIRNALFEGAELQRNLKAGDTIEKAYNRSQARKDAESHLEPVVTVAVSDIHMRGDAAGKPEQCGNQCRTLERLHTCTLPKGHRWHHAEYRGFSCPEAQWSDSQGHYPSRSLGDAAETPQRGGHWTPRTGRGGT